MFFEKYCGTPVEKHLFADLDNKNRNNFRASAQQDVTIKMRVSFDKFRLITNDGFNRVRTVEPHPAPLKYIKN